MTEKRYVIEEMGNMFRVLKDDEPLTTKFENCDKQDVTNLIAELNELHEENQAVKDIINELNSMDFYKDSALLNEYLGKIARILRVDYE